MKSGHKYVLELSEDAFDDLVNIQNYTYSVHGEGQWNKYEALLDKAMLQILEHPFLGTSATTYQKTIKPGMSVNMSWFTV